MNRLLVSPWPVVGLWLTWCCALLTYRLIPGYGSAVVAPLYWTVMPMFYGLALWYGYRRRERHGTGSQLLRLAVIGVGSVAALALNMVAAQDVSASIFYLTAVVQVSFGVVLSRERSLYGGLVVSTLMLGFAASRPRSDTPMLLMALPFFSCLVFTLVSNQFSQARQRMAAGAQRGGWLARWTSGVVALLLAFMLGVGIVSVTPMGGMGPLQWKLDRDFLMELAGGGTARGDMTGNGQAGGPASGSGGTESVFAGTLRRELSNADTLGDVLKAVSAAASATASDLLNKLKSAFSGAGGGGEGGGKAKKPTDDSVCWWCWLALLLLPLLFHRVRLRLVVWRDRWLRYGLTRRFVPDDRNVRTLGQSMDRLMELRGLPRPMDRTWSEHARQADVTSSEGKDWLALFARQHDELRYRGSASPQSLKAGWPAMLHETYLAVYDTVKAQPGVHRRLTRRQSLAQRFALLSPRRQAAWKAWRARSNLR